MKSVVEFIKISNYQIIPYVIMKFRSAVAIKIDPSIVGGGVGVEARNSNMEFN